MIPSATVPSAVANSTRVQSFSSGARSSETDPPFLTLIVRGSSIGALPRRVRPAPTTCCRDAEPPAPAPRQRLVVRSFSGPSTRGSQRAPRRSHLRRRPVARTLHRGRTHLDELCQKPVMPAVSPRVAAPLTSRIWQSCAQTLPGRGTETSRNRLRLNPAGGQPAEGPSLPHTAP